VTVRLNKHLASRGIASRRRCDLLVRSGVVRVNGVVCTAPGTPIDPARDVVEVEGRVVPGRPRPLYYVLHKPVGVICTLRDPEGRRTIAELMPRGPRLFPVGRLDADTSGLVIVTNDGDLAHHLMHPRYGVTKCYRAHADRPPSPAMLERLKHGIEFEPGVVSAPAAVRVLDATPGDTVIEIALHEGRYRQVRRMLEAAGVAVHRLHRWAYGPLKLGGLPRGESRALTPEEVAALRAASARPRPRPAIVRTRPRVGRGRAAAPAAAGRERAPREYRGVALPGLPPPVEAPRHGRPAPPRSRPRREAPARPAAGARPGSRLGRGRLGAADGGGRGGGGARAERGARAPRPRRAGGSGPGGRERFERPSRGAGPRAAYGAGRARRDAGAARDGGPYRAGGPSRKGRAPRAAGPARESLPPREGRRERMAPWKRPARGGAGGSSAAGEGGGFGRERGARDPSGGGRAQPSGFGLPRGAGGASPGRRAPGRPGRGAARRGPAGPREGAR